ncbi:MAG: hypothetical protein V1874_00235 [Spirochaetota bacterium]
MFPSCMAMFRFRTPNSGHSYGKLADRHGNFPIQNGNLVGEHSKFAVTEGNLANRTGTSLSGIRTKA